MSHLDYLIIKELGVAVGSKDPETGKVKAAGFLGMASDHGLKGLPDAVMIEALQTKLIEEIGELLNTQGPVVPLTAAEYRAWSEVQEIDEDIDEDDDDLDDLDDEDDDE